MLSALNDTDSDDPYVHDEFLAIKDTVLEMVKGSFFDAFTSKRQRHLHRTVLACLVQSMHQLTGINMLIYWAAAIYMHQLGFSEFNARIMAAFNMTEYFIAGIAAFYFIDMARRRTLAMLSSAGMCICMVVLTVMSAVAGNDKGTPVLSAITRNPEAIVCVVFLYLFVTTFSMGWLAIGWLWPAELLPLRIRGPTNALAVSANWALNFMVVFCMPVWFTRIGYRTWIIFAVT